MSVHLDDSPALAPRIARSESAGQSELESMLRQASARQGSDLLLVADAPPTIFVNGEWVHLSPAPLSSEIVSALLLSLLSTEQHERLMNVRDLDMGFSVAGLGRFRINLHFQRGSLAAAIRAIPESIPAFETLGLPAHVMNFANFSGGLVLVTGGTGQGKSTTLAALIDHMNRNKRRHIITVEDPIEFAFRNRTCLIEQRQIGDDAPTFASALRHVLRQRPDVILIGELRDLETMASALTAAETGHLVLATLHTCNATQTIARMIDVFPAAQQGQVRTQLAASLRAILCQTLLHDQLNDQLVPATEVLVATAAVRRAIRDNETHLIHGMIETGRKVGMHLLEQSLEELVRAGRITPEAAILAAADPVRMQTMLGCAGTLPQDAILAVEMSTGTGGNIPWADTK